MERKIVEYLVSGKSFNAICRDLKVGRKRVAHIREMAREYGYMDGNSEWGRIFICESLSSENVKKYHR